MDFSELRREALRMRSFSYVPYSNILRWCGTDGKRRQDLYRL